MADNQFENPGGGLRIERTFPQTSYELGDVGVPAQYVIDNALLIDGSRSMLADLKVRNQKKLILYQPATEGEKYVSLMAPTSLSSSLSWYLPATSGIQDDLLMVGPSGDMFWSGELRQARGSRDSLDERLDTAMDEYGNLQGSFLIDIEENGVQVVENPTAINFVNRFSITENPAGVGKINLIEHFSRDIGNAETYLTNLDDKVGIGLVDPVEKLHVYITTGDIKHVIQTGAAGAAHLKLLGTDDVQHIVFANGLRFYRNATISTGGTSVMTLEKDTGDVGIGTDSPTEKLEVSGAVKVAGRIKNVTDPVDVQDAATKAYVQASGVIHHGGLVGLEDDDHPQYLFANGTRDLIGNLVVNPGVTVDGVDISNHSSRHENDGADEINVNGLSGLLADDQNPVDHAADHEIGGGDLVNHDNLTNFVVNEHIDHTTVTITAGVALVGGGDILTNRTIDFSIPDVSFDTINPSGQIIFYDPIGVNHNRITFENFESTLNHDNLTGYEVNEHLSLPNTIVNVLTDHNKAAHDVLNIDADTVDGVDIPNTIANILTDHNKVGHDALGLSHDSLVDVSANDHHNQLHNMTDVDDHSGGNHKIFYTDASGVVKELSHGAANSILTSNGVDVAPTWESSAIPSVHHTTHENDGLDEINVAGLSGLLADDQNPVDHALDHEIGGEDLVDHDNLTNFIINEHIDHTAVVITAGTALAGGGDISENHTINFNIPGVTFDTIDPSGQIIFYDTVGGDHNRIYFSDFEGAIDHGNILGIEDDDHTQYLLANGTRNLNGNLGVDPGITIDGIDISAIKLNSMPSAANADINCNTQNITNVGTVDGVTISNHNGRHENGGADEISVSGLSGLLADDQNPVNHAADHEIGGIDLIDHDNLTNFVTNEHINHTAVTITAGVALIGGGDISANRTIDFNIPDVSFDVIDPSGQLIFYDVLDVNHKRITFANFESTIDHGNIDGLDDDDHTQYLLANGLRNLAGNMAVDAGVTVDGIDISEIKLNSMPSAANGDIDCNTQKIINVVDPINLQDAATKNYVQTSGVIDHGGLVGLEDDDHPQYLFEDGTRELSGNMSVASTITIDGVDISEIKLNAMPTAANGDIDANIQKIVNVVDPVDQQDAATKNYVQSSGVIDHNNLYNVTPDQHHSQIHYHDNEILQFDGVNSDGGAFSFTTTGDVTFNQSVIVEEDTDADTQLKVAASSLAMIKISGSGGSGNLEFGRSSNTLGWWSDVLAKQIFTINNGTGNIGIDKTNPSSKLHVNGGDIEIQDSSKGLILHSATKRWRITIGDDGVLSATEL